MQPFVLLVSNTACHSHRHLVRTPVVHNALRFLALGRNSGFWDCPGLLEQRLVFVQECFFEQAIPIRDDERIRCIGAAVLKKRSVLGIFALEKHNVPSTRSGLDDLGLEVSCIISHWLLVLQR